MNYLNGRNCYLSGPIEYDSSSEDWRTPVKKILTEEFKINVFDPSLDPKQNQVPRFKLLREKGQFDELSKIAHEFVRADLSIVDRADFIIACLPHRIPVFGTAHEIIFSGQQKKPTLLVCPQGKDKFPTWPFGIIRHEFMFGDWKALYVYLSEVHKGLHKDNDRWYFVYHYFQKDGNWSYRP